MKYDSIMVRYGELYLKGKNKIMLTPTIPNVP